MSFSLKYLFAVISLAAIFTAALIYRTPLWASVAINLAVVILLSATAGVWMKKLNRTFWLPFCFFGWFYFVFCLNLGSINVLNSYSPGNQIADMVISHSNRDVRQASIEAAEEIVMAFRRFTDIVNVLVALIVGGLAGVFSSLLIRQKREA